ncbi:MAG: hypothetical protein EBY09_19345, partial [Verrucomicrobia bacterium]|nr:hypothetical protein [Verrucomicrobiota bacterium]
GPQSGRFLAAPIPTTRRLGGFPKPGDGVELAAFTLRVETLDGMRVARLRLERRPV